MAQFAIMFYAREVPFADLPPEELAAHEQMPDKIEELGGKIVTGFATQPAAQARTIRADGVSEGTFTPTEEQLGGFFIVEANDIDHAVSLGRLVPLSGGAVEVRPLLG
jgi:hypothetical protein